MVVVAGFFALVAGALAYRVAYGQALEAGHATLDSLALTVEKTAAVGAFAADQVLLQEVIDGLLRNPLVARVSIQMASGVQLQGPAGKAATPTPGPGTAPLTVTRTLSSPFDVREQVGQLSVVGDLDGMQEAARGQASALAVLMVSQIALIALLLQVAGAQLVGRPMARLARDLRAMQPGTPARLDVPAGHEHDEIGTLAASANDLLAANQVAFERERTLRGEVGGHAGAVPPDL